MLLASNYLIFKFTRIAPELIMGKHQPGRGVRAPESSSERAEGESSRGHNPTRSPAAEEEETRTERGVDQVAIETAVAKMLNEALPQALARALPGMAEVLKTMIGGKNDVGAKTGGIDSGEQHNNADIPPLIEDSDSDDDEETEVPRRAGKAEMPAADNDEREESRRGLERAQSLLGGGPGPGDLGAHAAAPAAISPLGARLASRPERDNPMRANMFPILISRVVNNARDNRAGTVAFVAQRE